MRHSQFKKLIEKYQRDQLSGKEKAMVDDWFEALAAGETPEGLTEEAKLHLKNKISREISKGKTTAFPDYLSDSGYSERIIRRTTLQAAASILLLATLSYAIWQFTGTNEGSLVALVKTSSSNHITKIVLDDGSIVWLKGNSTLVYPKEFTEKRRSITLQGEALFQVTKDSLSPFVIHCGDLITTVLGTSFNIKSNEKDIEVVVITGSVSLTSKNNKKGVIVLPNEKAKYLVSHQQIAKVEKEVNKPETEAALAGTEYTMRFEDTRMEEVIRRIEGKFDVTIKTADPGLGNCIITADFSGQSLDRTLSMIALALGFEYEIKQHKVVLSGAGCP